MSEIQWYIQVGGGKKAGPISFERLKELANQLRIFPGTNVRSTESESVWMPAKDVPNLFSQDEEKTPEPVAVSEESEPKPIENEPEIKENEPGTVPPDETSPTEPSASVSNTDDENIPQTEDSQMAAIPINESPKETEVEIKIAEPKKASSSFTIDTGKTSQKSSPAKNSAFAIDTGKSSSKPEAASLETAEAEKKDEKPTPETIHDTDSDLLKTKKEEKSSAAVKISIGGVSDKKGKEKKPEKSSAAFAISVGGGISEKKKEKPSVKIDNVESEDVSEKDSAGLIDQKKTSKKSKDKASSPVGKGDRKAKSPSPGGAMPGILKITSIISVLFGCGGGAGIVGLGMKVLGTPLSGILGGVVFLFGLCLGVVAWGLSSLIVRVAQQSEPQQSASDSVTEEQPEND